MINKKISSPEEYFYINRSSTGFTFQIAANHYDSRKSMLLEEVTNIRKTYLRAGLIDNLICSETNNKFQTFLFFSHTI